MIVCTDCGVVQKGMDAVRMAQTFNQSQQNSVTAHFQQLGCVAVDKKYKFVQLQANVLTKTKAQNRMQNLTKKMDSIADRMRLCKRITDRASILMYASLENKKMRRIKKDELLAAVCVVLAAREARIQFTFREVSEACENVTKKEICRVYKQHERVLGKQEKKLDIEQIKFSSMINRFTSLIGIEWMEQKKMRKLYNKINQQSELSTLNPLTRLACSIYLIMGQKKENCAMVSLACNVSEHTILRSSVLVRQFIP